MVSIHRNPSVLFATFFLLQFLSIVESVKLSSSNQAAGFTIDLVHRDSPSSPLHNPSADKYDLLRDSIRRSISRINNFKSISSSLPSSPNAQAPVLPIDGSYLMNISIGTPPKPFLGIADTGSDLIWTQCKPCPECYKQELPIFDPENSKTYKPSSCRTRACNFLENRGGCSRENTCLYTYSYGDRSQTIGELAYESLTFDKSTSFDNVIFGCGHKNGGNFSELASGLIGLGGGPLSLVKQLKSGGSKFAYCLIPYGDQTSSDSSKISFGSKGKVSGKGVVSTPLADKYPPTFYFLTLESITVGKGSSSESKKILAPARLRNASEEDEGNIIIDSGTTLTFLPDDMYQSLVHVLQENIQGEQVEDPQGQLGLCYKYDSNLVIPNVTATFAGDAHVELSPVNTFIATAEDVACLAIVSTEDGGPAIFGNISQQDFLVGYDLDEKTVSFKRTNCKKHV